MPHHAGQRHRRRNLQCQILSRRTNNRCSLISAPAVTTSKRCKQGKHHKKISTAQSALLFVLGLTACEPTFNDPKIVYYTHDFTDDKAQPYGTRCTVIQVEAGGHFGEVIQESRLKADAYLIEAREGVTSLTARCHKYLAQPDGTQVKTLSSETIVNDLGPRKPIILVGSSENVPAKVIARFKAQPNVTTSGVYPIVQFR